MPRYLILSGAFDTGHRAGDEIDLPADVAALHATQLKLLAAVSPAKPAPPPALYGSDLLPALFRLESGKDLQLGQIVAAAHEASGLSVEAWNALESDAREALLDVQLIRMIEADKAASSSAP